MCPHPGPVLLNPWLFALLQDAQGAMPSGAVPAGGPSREPLWHCLPTARTAEGPSCGEEFGQDLLSDGGERPLHWGIAAGAWGDSMSWGDPSTDWCDLHRVKCLACLKVKAWLLTFVLGRANAPSAAGTHISPLGFASFGKYIHFPQVL